MPTRREAPKDILGICLQLQASRGAPMPLEALRERFGSGIDRLLEIGAASPGRPLSRVKCSACFSDHSAEIEYDGATRRSSIFCPEAGRVWIEDRELETLRMNSNWLPDQIANALSIAPSPPRRTIIDGAAWLLGDTTVGGTNVSIALAVGIAGAAELEQLGEGLKRRQPLDIGLLLMARCWMPKFARHGMKYESLALDEITTFEHGMVCANQARLSAWVRGLAEGHSRPHLGRSGRPSAKNQVLAIFEMRRDRGAPYVSKKSEAKAIIREWHDLHPDVEPPAQSTIRGHMPELERFDVA